MDTIFSDSLTPQPHDSEALEYPDRYEEKDDTGAVEAEYFPNVFDDLDKFFKKGSSQNKDAILTQELGETMAAMAMISMPMDNPLKAYGELDGACFTQGTNFMKKRLFKEVDVVSESPCKRQCTSEAGEGEDNSDVPPEPFTLASIDFEEDFSVPPPSPVPSMLREHAPDAQYFDSAPLENFFDKRAMVSVAAMTGKDIKKFKIRMEEKIEQKKFRHMNGELFGSATIGFSLKQAFYAQCRFLSVEQIAEKVESGIWTQDKANQVEQIIQEQLNGAKRNKVLTPRSSFVTFELLRDSLIKAGFTYNCKKEPRDLMQRVYDKLLSDL